MNAKTTETVFWVLLLIVGFSAMAEAATRTWTGGGTDNNWSTTNNWSSGIVPGSADDAIFDGTATKDATVDGAFGGTANNLTLAVGYTGTITLNRSLTVNVAYAQTNGVFNAGTNNVTIGLGSSSGKGHFTLAGGIFQSPSNTLTISGYANTVAQTGGTFNHNNGTVVFHGWNTTLNAPNMTFYGLTVDMNASSDTMNAIYVAAGTTNVVLGPLVHNCGLIRQVAAVGTLEARSNVVVGAAAKGGSATIAFLVAGDQTISCVSTGATCGLYINKPSGAVNVLGGDLILGTGASTESGNFTLAGGTFNCTSNAFIQRGYNNSWTQSGGTFNHNGGTVVFRGYNTYVYPTNTTFNGLTVEMGDPTYNCTFPQNMTNVVLGNMAHNGGVIVNGFLDLRGNLSVGPAAAGGNGTIAFLTNVDQVINCATSGATCGLYINKASGAVGAIGGNLGIGKSTSTTTAGNFTLAGGTFNSTSNSFVFWGYSRNWIQSGGTFNPSNGTVVFRGFNIGFYGTNTGFNKLTVNLDSNVGGYTFAMPAGMTSVVASTYVHSNGAVNAGTILAQGDVVIGGPSCPGGTASLIFGGTNDQTFLNQGGTNIAGAVTVNKAGGSVILASPMSYMNANQDLTIAAGTLNLAGYALSVKRTLTLGSQGTLKFNGTEQATATNVTVNAGATVKFSVP